MTRPLILIFAMLFVAITCFGQSRHKNSDNSLAGVPFKERIVVGGGLGLQFGSQVDMISIAPMAGYKVTEKLMLGSGITYRYTKYKYYNPSIKLIDYGVNPFARYTIFNGIFLHAEYEYLNYEFPVSATESIRDSFNSFLAGGGFFQPIGDKAAFYLLALYNFSYKDVQQGEYTPYPNPLILRGGITIGF
jgi:hypothetical protein